MEENFNSLHLNSVSLFPYLSPFSIDGRRVTPPAEPDIRTNSFSNCKGRHISDRKMSLISAFSFPNKWASCNSTLRTTNAKLETPDVMLSSTLRE
jgi:hypothetical protein